MKFIWNNFRFWIQFSSQFTFSSKNSNNCFNMCSNNCFLLEQFLIVCLPPGASWLVHSLAFATGGSPFFDPFFGALFFTQNCDCGRKTVPKWSQNEIIWSLFFRKNAKTKKCVSTAQACADCMWAHPMERPRRPQNQRKNITYFRTYFFNHKMQKYAKKGSQKVSKRVTGFPGWRPWGRLGRPLTPQSVFEHKKYAQSAPKMAPRVQKLHQQARRTARSD